MRKVFFLVIVSIIIFSTFIISYASYAKLRYLPARQVFDPITNLTYQECPVLISTEYCVEVR